MFSNDESTTLMCLFHHKGQADAALNDLDRADIPASAIAVIGRDGTRDADAQTLASLGVPSRDLAHLKDGIEGGGVLIVVSGITDQVAAVERIFGDHRASKIDETAAQAVESDPSTGSAVLPLAAAAAGAATIPIVEEELAVGKRTVDRGGVRVFRRVVEMPAEETVVLREQHVVVERNAVDRPATASDLETVGEGSVIELQETAEEAVISKSAHVVEEVLISKGTSEHVEHIEDTVRRSEIEIEQLPTTDLRDTTNRRP